MTRGRRAAQFAAAAMLVASAACAHVAPAPPVSVDSVPFTGEFPRMDLGADLHGRHDEIWTNRTFQTWKGDDGTIGRWFEEGTAVGEMVVTVQNQTETSAIGAIVRLRDGKRTVIQIAPVDLVSLPIPRGQALELFRVKFPGAQIRSIRPLVTFESSFASVRWIIETSPPLIDRYEVDQAGKIIRSVLSGSGLRTPNDFLREDELHHFGLVRSWTLRFLKSGNIDPKKTRAAAKAISTRVKDSIEYNAALARVWEFTFADTLTLIWKDPGRFEIEEARGVCDEYAVVAISALRSIGIEARLKFLQWTDPATHAIAGHACLEYREGNAWIHMDPTFGLVDDPEYYRRVFNVTSVLVMDADDPQDSRAITDHDQIPDPNDDGVLQPLDFVLSAPQARHRYSQP